VHACRNVHHMRGKRSSPCYLTWKPWHSTHLYGHMGKGEQPSPAALLPAPPAAPPAAHAAAPI